MSALVNGAKVKTRKYHRVKDGDQTYCGVLCGPRTRVLASREAGYMRAFILRHDRVQPCQRCWPDEGKR